LHYLLLNKKKQKQNKKVIYVIAGFPALNHLYSDIAAAWAFSHRTYKVIFNAGFPAFSIYICGLHRFR